MDEQLKRKIFVFSFAIDTYEVSNAGYLAFVNETLHKLPFKVYEESALSSEEAVVTNPSEINLIGDSSIVPTVEHQEWNSHQSRSLGDPS